MTMFTLAGDPAAMFRKFRIPAGAEVAIVSSRPDAVKEIEHSGEHFVAVRRVYADAVSKARSAVINKRAFEPDARAHAILEGVRIAQADLQAAGGAYDLDQVRGLMRGISRQAVHKRVQDGSLLAVPGPSNRQSFPTVQFNSDGTVVDGLSAVHAALPTRNPWSVLNFLTNPDDRLGGRKPIDVLKEGGVDVVVEAARRMGEQGA
ncbi:hypothetical protein [Beijerinckia sp. L45]|uniref:hypothetical protein n=1 Tax=Beijerinckia sp. L45 TaxID=1641855 RepID=UPI001FEEAAD3|nr:hypothetical protein [Beijerinckia sp. L45]